VQTGLPDRLGATDLLGLLPNQSLITPAVVAIRLVVSRYVEIEVHVHGANFSHGEQSTCVAHMAAAGPRESVGNSAFRLVMCVLAQLRWSLSLPTSLGREGVDAQSGVGNSRRGARFTTLCGAPSSLGYTSQGFAAIEKRH